MGSATSSSPAKRGRMLPELVVWEDKPTRHHTLRWSDSVPIGRLRSGAKRHVGTTCITGCRPKSQCGPGASDAARGERDTPPVPGPRRLLPILRHPRAYKRNHDIDIQDAWSLT